MITADDVYMFGLLINIGKAIKIACCTSLGAGLLAGLTIAMTAWSDGDVSTEGAKRVVKISLIVAACMLCVMAVYPTDEAITAYVYGTSRVIQ